MSPGRHHPLGKGGSRAPMPFTSGELEVGGGDAVEAARCSQRSAAQATPLSRTPRTTSNECLEHKGKTSSFLPRLLRRGLSPLQSLKIWVAPCSERKIKTPQQVWADIRPTQTMYALEFPNTCLLKLHQMENEIRKNYFSSTDSTQSCGYRLGSFKNKCTFCFTFKMLTSG